MELLTVLDLLSILDGRVSDVGTVSFLSSKKDLHRGIRCSEHKKKRPDVLLTSWKERSSFQ